LGAHASGAQPRDVRLQPRLGDRDVDFVEVVAGKLADRPRQVVVAVDNRAAGQ
jgi:hypothetical protein